MKLTLSLAVLVVLGFVGAFHLGARSSRPDLKLTPVEELSIMRAEVAFTSSPLATSSEKDQAKIKAFADAKEAKRRKAIELGAKIKKAHHCETCALIWNIGVDGSMELVMQTPNVQIEK
jgi:hypothetical protein